ncbi:YggS family pyridoxal phosphate-dependent enzyme [Parabacteroides sp. OttesenSCG-928-N08]|nr:YggS family pyridoxal phosphate-dependent enzyme [Parabacteroides sp. OttesenSCG-928-N08]
MSIKQRIQQLQATLPKGVSLVAVSKFHPAESLMQAYEAGQRIFGESRAQELKAKQALLPNDIEWHFIGTLQSNKVKDIAAYVHTIHSVDSLKLMQEIEKQAAKHQREIRILLEIHIAEEETKQGLSPEACRLLLQQYSPINFPHLRIVGLMCMATYTDDERQIRDEFRRVNALFLELKETLFADDPQFNVLSMGMSHDYPIAIEEGSTMIRVGTLLFGEREY